MSGSEDDNAGGEVEEDDGEVGFLDSSESKHEEDTNDFDWEAKLLGGDDDGVGYGNITKEVVEWAKMKVSRRSKA